MFKCFYFYPFPFPGTVFGNGKTSDYLLLGNTVYTVSLYWPYFKDMVLLLLLILFIADLIQCWALRSALGVRNGSGRTL